MVPFRSGQIDVFSLTNKPRIGQLFVGKRLVHTFNSEMFVQSIITENYSSWLCDLNIGNLEVLSVTLSLTYIMGRGYRDMLVLDALDKPVEECSARLPPL